MTKRGNKVSFYKFNLGDVEDPDMYAQLAANKFLSTDVGKWAEAHVEDGLWLEYFWDETEFFHVISISGYLDEKHFAYYELKYKNENID